MMFQLLDGVEVKICRFVGGGQTFGRRPAKGGVRLDLQEVGGNVGRAAILNQLQRLVELGLRIMGQGPA